MLLSYIAALQLPTSGPKGVLGPADRLENAVVLEEGLFPPQPLAPKPSTTSL